MIKISLIVFAFILIIIALVLMQDNNNQKKQHYLGQKYNFTINGPQFYFPGQGSMYT